MNNLTIKSSQWNYEVSFFKNIEDTFNLIDGLNDQYFILIDEKVLEIYRDKLFTLNRFPIYSVTASENTKTLEGVQNFSEWLINNGASKSSKIFAIGGGIIQDLATFTAHVMKRGIKWEFMPTTLLSQSDSCIGAKCGINVHPFKNQLGVMHSPSRVLIVEEFLSSLDEETFQSGYGEILKLSLTPPATFYGELQTEFEEFGIRKDRALPWIYKSLLSKQQIIEVDEYEVDLRRILNYGHTFGHALEGISNNKVSHGFGVIFGIDLINYLAVQWGLLSSERFLEIRETIKTYFALDFLPRNLTALDLINAIKTDKKVADGFMNFAVLNEQGQLTVLPKSIDQNLLILVEKYLADECIFSAS